MKILFMTSAAPDKAGFSTAEKRPPLGVGYLMAALKKCGHTVFFSDEYLKPSKLLVSDFVENNGIDYVGIYSNTICYESTLNLLEILNGKRKEGKWSGKIVVGGPHTSVGMDDFPDYVDHIVIGEGEITLPKILDGEIKDRVVYGEKVLDLDDLPRPAWEHFIHLPYDWTLKWFPQSVPVFTMNTSRGCPFNCSFCSVKAIWGKTFRHMSAERVVEDIEHMVQYYGARAIYFREDHFTLNKKRVFDFCNLLIKKGIEIDWFCESRVDNLQNPEIINLMAKAGCKALYIGVESGSPRMLEFYKKGETVEQFITAFDLIRKAQIKTYASFVVGFPTETKEDIILTDKLIERIEPDYVGKNVYLGIPGSELYDYVKKNNLYEYIDDRKILYPKNFKKNCRKYYGFNPYYDLYSLDMIDSLKTKFIGISRSAYLAAKSLQNKFGITK